MKDYNSVVTRKLILSLIASALLPTGILLIIFGAENNAFMLISGIIATVIGFYGTPILWIKYGESKTKAFVYRLIMNEHMYTVDEIATQTTYSKEKVSGYINEMIAAGYITGYFFKEGKLILNTNTKQTEQTTETIKCPACGGVMRYNGLTYVCEYCRQVKNKE